MANQIVGVKVKKVAGIILGVAIGLSGCGGNATNNDQGASFLATGYQSDVAGDEGLTGVVVSLFDTSAGAGVVAYMQLQNRLSAQFLRVTQISCSYEVPGSSVSLFQDSYNSSAVITAGGSATMGFQLVSRDVIAYFANRINELPQFPFRMNVDCYATAISQAGDIYQSNPLGIQVILTDDATVVEEADADGAVVDEGTIDEDAIGDVDDTENSSSSSSSSITSPL